MVATVCIDVPSEVAVVMAHTVVPTEPAVVMACIVVSTVVAAKVAPK